MLLQLLREHTAETPCDVKPPAHKSWQGQIAKGYGGVFLRDVSSIRQLGESSARFPKSRWEGGGRRDAKKMTGWFPCGTHFRNST